MSDENLQPKPTAPSSATVISGEQLFRDIMAMPELRPAPKLARKLALVMGEMSRVKKGGYNQHHQYAFATAGDVEDMVREELAKAGVAFFPRMVAFSTRKATEKSLIYCVQFAMTFIDGESGESLTSQWFAEAMDSQDKGLNKAATAAVKYFLLKTFLISTGEIPDADAGDDEGRTPDRQPAPVQNTTPEQLAEMKSLVQSLEGEWAKFEAAVKAVTKGPGPEAIPSLAAARWIDDLKRKLEKKAKAANAVADKAPPPDGTEAPADQPPADQADTSRVRGRMRGARS